MPNLDADLFGGRTSSAWLENTEVSQNVMWVMDPPFSFGRISG